MLQQIPSEVGDTFTLYRSDIRQFAATLPSEERMVLLHYIDTPFIRHHANQPLPATREALVDCTLWLPIRIACKACRSAPFLWEYLPDLIQEGNLGLLKAAEKAPMQDMRDLSHFFNYAAKYIRMEICQFLIRRRPISVHYKKHWRVRQSGDEEAMRALYRLMTPLSTDVANTFEKTPLNYFGEEDLYDDDEATEENHQGEARGQVEELLACLPEKEQWILRLRYGLDDEDGCTYSQQEVARIVGLSLSQTRTLERQALKRLRGEMVPASRELAVREREARLLAIYQEWQTQGKSIGIIRLAREGNCSTHDATLFLRAHEGEAYKKRESLGQLKQNAQERLQAALCQMQAQGVPITTVALSRAARADYYTAQRFLKKEAEAVQLGGVQ